MTEALSKAQLDAADWFARLQGDDVDVAVWEEFRAWLESDSSHREAYDAVEAVWLDLESPEVVAPAPSTVVAWRAPQRRRLFIGLGVAAAAAAVIAVVGPALFTAPVEHFTTAKGERREIALADGSHLHLSSATELDVRLTRSQRQVTLVRGEASFDVAHLPDRPFIVTAGSREVRVLGTEFNILQDAGTFAVTVRRGLVAVAGAGGGKPYKLAKGDQLRVSGQNQPVVTRTDPDAAFAWTQGRLVYSNTPLATVAADLSRYLPVPIRVDASAQSVVLSGVLLLDNEDAMIERLQLFAPIEVKRGANEFVLRAKATRP